MRTALSLVVAAGIGLGAAALASPSAAALPAGGLNPALASASDAAGAVQNIRWVCDADGDDCRWVPGWRHHGGWHRYGYWRPGWGYGYDHPWRHYGWYGGGPYGYEHW